MIDHDNVFKAIFFYNNGMAISFNAWPEVLFIDGTYKLLKNGYTVILMAVVDGMGQTEIVSVGVVMNETEDVYK